MIILCIRLTVSEQICLCVRVLFRCVIKLYLAFILIFCTIFRFFFSPFFPSFSFCRSGDESTIIYHTIKYNFWFQTMYKEKYKKRKRKEEKRFRYRYCVLTAATAAVSQSTVSSDLDTKQCLFFVFLFLPQELMILNRVKYYVLECE